MTARALRSRSGQRTRTVAIATKEIEMDERSLTWAEWLVAAAFWAAVAAHRWVL